MGTNEETRKLLGKIELSGELLCESGLHIGASKENLEIGALDSPVVRDPISNEPYIPGSSLKGKLRALLEKATLECLPNWNGGTRSNPVWRHECRHWDKGTTKGERQFEYPGSPNCEVCRLFGSTGDKNYPARLKVRDLPLLDDSRKELDQLDTGLYLTEWKFENSIDRVTSAANPRNLERVPRGTKFEFSMIYDVEDLQTLQADLENLKLAVRILEDDALGGHGSRGYGWVKLEFEPTTAKKIDWYKGDEAAKTGAKPLNQLGDDDFKQLAAFFREAIPAKEKAA